METPHAFLDTLRSERHRLQNAVDHLVQSNAELRAAFEETADRDFKVAVEVRPGRAGARGSGRL